VGRILAGVRRCLPVRGTRPLISTKTCTKCGIVKDIGEFRRCLRWIGGRCKDCEKVYKKAYHVKNQDWANQYCADYRARNRDEILKDKARYRVDNADKVRIGKAKWYAENKDRVLRSRAKWRAENLEKAAVFVRVRRARARGAEGTHTAEDIDRIRQLQKDRCVYWKIRSGCKGKLHGKGHVDHIVPLSKGGSNWPSNLQLTCAPCNLSKRDKDPVTFAQNIGLLC